MDWKKIVYDWIGAGSAEKSKGKPLSRLVLVGAGSVALSLVRVIVPLVVVKFVGERFFGPFPFSFMDLVLVYVGFWFLRMDDTLAHAGNLAIKFAGLPYILSLAWTQVLPLFWAARPAMGFGQVWLGYVGIYAVATVLSQVLNPKQVL